MTRLQKPEENTSWEVRNFILLSEEDCQSWASINSISCVKRTLRIELGKKRCSVLKHQQLSTYFTIFLKQLLVKVDRGASPGPTFGHAKHRCCFGKQHFPTGRFRPDSFLKIKFMLTLERALLLLSSCTVLQGCEPLAKIRQTPLIQKTAISGHHLTRAGGSVI